MSQNTPTPPPEPTDPSGQGQPPRQPAPSEPPAQPYREPSGTYQQPGEPHQQQPSYEAYQQPVGERPVGDRPFYAAAASSAGDVARNDTKGFFGALFDYSFMTYVTPKVVKIVYIIATVVIALGWLIALVAAFNYSVWSGILFLLFGWILALVYLALVRITLEFYQAIVSVSEKVNRYAQRDGMV
jgi:hypothetical protein